MATYVGLLRALNQLGLETPFFVRTDREWHGIIADNPFPKEAKTDR